MVLPKVSIFWFRRDLRLEDNAGLYQALCSEFPVLPIFIFDTSILNQLDSKVDRRVNYIHQALSSINAKLNDLNTGLSTFLGNPIDIFKALNNKYDVQEVYCNRDYEPRAKERDKEIYQYFKDHNIAFRGFKDQVIFDKNDVLKSDNTPYTVYTPYAKKWKTLLEINSVKQYDCDLSNFLKYDFPKLLTLADIGFEETDSKFKEPVLDVSIISEYDKYRDYPALQGTTSLGIALRFGTISIRKCVMFAMKHNQVWLNELIWREFFMQILHHFPKVTTQSFKIKNDAINWRNDEIEFEKWCSGKTGYPIVDAGMRQLNSTGYMHNRVRMIAASFLCKHLLIDWRWGEAYFAQKLNDYDLAANNGNWQWAAGSGCDAAPYFRIFNPTAQTIKFDKKLEYIKKWLPEFEEDNYLEPIVNHTFARERALKAYAKALN